jgi:hypothetical protein
MKKFIAVLALALAAGSMYATGDEKVADKTGGFFSKVAGGFKAAPGKVVGFNQKALDLGVVKADWPRVAKGQKMVKAAIFAAVVPAVRALLAKEEGSFFARLKKAGIDLATLKAGNNTAQKIAWSTAFYSMLALELNAIKNVYQAGTEATPIETASTEESAETK